MKPATHYDLASLFGTLTITPQRHPMRFPRALLALAVLLALPLRAQTTITTTQAARFTSSCVALRCTFDASPSDSTGNAIAYTWTWGDGRTETHATPTVTNSWQAPGTYPVQLTITRRVQATALSVATNTLAIGTITPAPAPVPAPIPAPSPPSSTRVAELPRVYLNTAAPAVTGTIRSVSTASQLTAALSAAQPGDAIELAPGTYSGTFTLTNKGASTNVITIRPANWRQLPPEGTRMRPSVAAALALPRLEANNPSGAGVILTAPGAHHWRIEGLEVAQAPSVPHGYDLIALDANASTVADLPHDIVIDRVYAHGNAGQPLRRCVLLNTGAAAVIDSWIADCKDAGSDSQGIAAWTAAGPFKIVNNHIEAAGENVMTGGADPSVANITPSDIEIRGNHLTKPIAWKGGPWQIKNLLELKHAQRVLIIGNVMEGSWQAAQNGLGIGLKTVNQQGRCTWCVTQDVTVRKNIIRDVGAGINLAASPDNNYPDIPARRLVVDSNLVARVNRAPYVGDGRAIGIFGALTDVQVIDNTIADATNAGVVFGPAGTRTTRTVLTGNVINGGSYGVVGDNAGGAAALALYAPDGTVRGNLFFGPGYITLPGNVALPTFSFFPDFSQTSYPGIGGSIVAVLAATAAAVVAP